jgi:C-terminal processing protease CtpA/Prc
MNRSLGSDLTFVTACAAVLLMGAALLRLPAPALGQASPSLQYPATPSTGFELDNVRAFARLYGYVRFFHPSDEVASTDWNRFAVYGVSRLRTAPNPDALRHALEELFLPIAPTVQIYSSHDPPEPMQTVPDDTTGLQLVAWQHVGVGLNPEPPYRSRRLARPSEEESVRHGVVVQEVDVSPIRGMAFRCRATVRTDVEGEGNRLRLLARMDGPGGRIAFLDDMSDRPITSAEWVSPEIQGKIPAEASAMYIGAYLDGEGQAWIELFELEVSGEDGDWSGVTLQNPRFEAGPAGVPPPGWSTAGADYSFTVVEDVQDRARALRVTSTPLVATDSRLFDAHPSPGESFERGLGRGLSARVPLTLFSDATGTLRPSGAPDVAVLQAALDEVSPAEFSADDMDVRLGAVVGAWNVYQHFYPYFDVVATDWSAALDEAITSALSDANADDFDITLRRMLHHLQDGHAFLSRRGAPPAAWLPLSLEYVEGELVVVATAEPESVLVGDVVLEIDEVPAAELVEREMALRSGSEQWLNVAAPYFLASGPAGGHVHLRVLRGSVEHEVVLVRDRDRPAREARPEEIAEVTPGIFYVDMSRATTSAFTRRVEEIATARGVIFDLRGYPNFNHQILSFLTDQQLQGPPMLIPQIIYPDRERMHGYHDSDRLTMSPQHPRLTGHLVFLTNARAMSYAESVMSLVEAYEFAEIVGGPTAGANGVNNVFEVPGGYSLGFTGMRVLKHDGSQHHLIGIRPTVPVERTIRGVREGRDELLEQAINLIESSVADGRDLPKPWPQAQRLIKQRGESRYQGASNPAFP